ncbi:MAG: ATP-dependent zinc metalloprotease FtsH [Rubrobacter sp.]|nr:ATP-dependent zinc metalloprotease FtsH [Rubrobacter sp.]
MVFAVILIQLLNSGNSEVTELDSQEFQTQVQNNNFVTDPQDEENALIVLDEDQTVEGVLQEPVRGNTQFEYPYPSDFNIDTAFSDAEIPYETDPQNTGFWANLLFTLGPILLIILLFLFIFSSMQGGGNKVMSFGKSRAKKMNKDAPKVTFNDVAGAQEAVQELTEIKEFLESPQKFQKLGARIPKGALLVGPPGTGKTLLARAVAGEAGVPFFSISGSDFVEMFVGVGASRVRDLFEQAKQNAPCIIFMDEIDAVGRQRGAGMGGGHDEREQTLNQLLVEMDGFDSKSGIIMIAATNRADILDPALLRPGRFDRQIVVDAPDLAGREKILEVHTRGKPLAENVTVENVARSTPGFTGADLANLVNESALLAARYDKEEITMSELEEAVDRVIAGPERKTRLISSKEKEITAYHESGHAIVGSLSTGADPVHKVSIIPRGQALGVTMSLPEEDRYMMSTNQLMSQLSMMLGGRAAERVTFDEVTTGASNDLERVTGLARQMVTKYGMSEKLGPLSLGSSQQQVFMGRDLGSGPEYSDEIAFQIDKEIRRIVDESYDTAEELLTRNKGLLEKLSQDLIEYETVDREHLKRLIDEYAVDEIPTGGKHSRNGHGEPGE